jgi:uncharacterized protein (DUF1697 family)
MAGHNSIKMNDLSVLFKNLGYPDAMTYIQSGNVIFSCDKEIAINDISTNIEKGILERFNYSIPALIRTIQEMKELMLLNPFLGKPDFDSSKMAVIFLYSEPGQHQIHKVADIDYPPDKFKIIGREIFIYCPNGFGKTRLYTNFFEKKMGVIGTARNWKTINKLLEIAEEISQV